MPTRRQAAMMAAAASRDALKQEAFPIAPEMPSEPSMSEGEREHEADREFKVETDEGTAGGPPAISPVARTLEPIEAGPVRTKFPTARIKRIMQADEEVGKVAQQTPIAVGKALELFMSQLVTKSAEIARAKGTKRVTAPMLKHVVENDPQWDFLQEIVGKVPEQEKEGKGRSKADTESEGEIGEPKKKGRGRKKKAPAE
ncbi:uncharacterized protein J7T54_005774 [Emericellopsis cladophorae]|uniref:Transcription factor CBF/NF-Y/archaeal histone domain-containing protein n=1 Tax=Emericellopsis cladophorae TaxID=2686198 RepID=A0A9P9XYM7_9HYPO|nr:uncharacterized protein J7T54_005774 [Emericellopsis cladophorae]KAI6779744.1 hypothetical protein J7T54_005774 [Emericellopsis cladophorae]